MGCALTGPKLNKLIRTANSVAASADLAVIRWVLAMGFSVIVVVCSLWRRKIVTQPTRLDSTAKRCDLEFEGDFDLYTLARLEETSLSIMLRESGLAFFSSLTLHSLAMAFVVGINLALAFSLLGLIPNLLNSHFRSFLRFHWWAAGLIFLSGLALLIAYPAKALTNPVFYLKFFALSVGLLITWRLQHGHGMTAALSPQADARPGKDKSIGATMLLCWIVTISAGRFLAYTHSVLLASRYY